MPSAPFLVPPLLLIAVLAVSAVAKVRDPFDTASVFRQLGLPQVLIRLRAPRLLPYGELVLAGALLLAPDGWYTVTATAALLLFLAYFLVILRALRLPYPVTCGCFGRLGLGEVTGRTLVRNGVLLALALVMFVDAWRADGVVQRLRDLPGGLWWLAAVVLLTAAVVLLPFLRRPTQPGPSYEEPDPDAYLQVPIPDGVLHEHGHAVPVWQLSDVAARLLVFCDPARDEEVVANARAWASKIGPVKLQMVTEDETDLTASDVLHDPGGAFRRALGVGSPGAVLLGTNRMLAGGPVDGLEQMAALVHAMLLELGVADAK